MPKLTTTAGPIDFFYEAVAPATVPQLGSITFRIDAGNVGTFQNIDGTLTGWVPFMLAGGDIVFDQLNVAQWTLMDNNAVALRVGATGAPDMLVFNTVDGAEQLEVQDARLTVRDGVVGGTDRIVGGRAFSSVVDSTAIVQAAAGYVAFDETYSIPANTLKAGTTLHIRAVVRITTLLNAGALLQAQLRLGGVAILTSPDSTAGAVGSRCLLEAWLTVRGAPGAAVELSGASTAIWTDTVAVVTTQPLAAGAVPTFATNGALVVDAAAEASAAGDGSGRIVLEQLLVEIE